MRGPRHTIITMGIALAVSAVGVLAGMSLGTALVIGAVAGIAASIYLQRREKAKPFPDVLDDPADIEAAVQSTGMAALDFRTRSSTVADTGVTELTDRINSEFSRMVTLLDQPDRREAAPLLLDQVFDPAAALMTDYAWMQDRGGIGSAELMRKIASRDLPKVETAARQANAVLERPGKLDIDSLRRAVGFSLDDSIEPLPSDPTDWGNRQRIVDQAERADR